MKKSNSFCLVGIFMTLGLLLSGCGNQSVPAQQTAGKSEKTIVMRIGHATKPNAPRDLNVLEFGKTMESKFNGKIKVEDYPSSQLGNNSVMQTMVAQGALEATVVPTAFSSQITKNFQLMDLPFLFPNLDKAVEFMQSQDAKELLKIVEPKGYKALAFWPSDTKLMTANKPIEKMEDIKGLKFRVMAGDVLMDTYKSWGASAIPLALNELYTALAQKTVDAEENTMGTIYDSKLYEVNKYVMESNHSLTADVFLVNKVWFEGLSADMQKAMIDEATQLISVRKKQEIDRNNDIRKELKSKGVNFVNISPEEKQRFRTAAQPAYDNFLEANPTMKPLVDTIQNNFQ